VDQNFLLGGGDPCLCDIEQLVGELLPKKRLSTWHLEYGIVKAVVLRLNRIYRAGKIQWIFEICCDTI
jgi:hypothetical protein